MACFGINLVLLQRFYISYDLENRRICAQEEISSGYLLEGEYEVPAWFILSIVEVVRWCFGKLSRAVRGSTRQFSWRGSLLD